MKLYKGLLLSAIILGGSLGMLSEAVAQESPSLVKKAKSAKQRVAANQERRNMDFSDFGNEYSEFKNWLSKEYGFDYALDISYMPQRGAPGGKKTSYQTIINPSFTWQNFKNEYGTGTLNGAYNVVRYGGSSAATIGNNIGAVTNINDFDNPSNGFDELYYSYQLGGSWDWLTLNAGQFPMYNFDGTTYNSNQQVNFINYALAQNATSTYPVASLGGFVQIAPNSEWTVVVGAQDGTNVSGESISTRNLNEEHYTTFASLSYTPTINGRSGQYSVLVYNQPNVDLQAETTNGWSLNMSQDLTEKLAVFARVNGVSGSIADIDQSWVLGMVYNNPLNRNPLDQIGFAGAYNKINEDAVGSTLSNKNEKILEAYWAWGVSKWMTITPDIQFYIDPALNPKSNYDTVFSLRGTLFF